MYFTQFRTDLERRRIRALNAHTETLSLICDSRLKLDPTPFWTRLDGLFAFSNVHEEYRVDPEREEKWEHYAKRLKDVYERLDLLTPLHLLKRMEKQIELLRNKWPGMDSLVELSNEEGKQPLPLFYSYSHRDEGLRELLQSHLSLLKRTGVIHEWHDRRISAGREWEGQIDSRLASAKIILLLISADFLASAYCYDVEMKTAMELHATRAARVIPVILRACDWHQSPFGKLQAVPRDGLPVTSWTKSLSENPRAFKCDVSARKV